MLGLDLGIAARRLKARATRKPIVVWRIVMTSLLIVSPRPPGRARSEAARDRGPVQFQVEDQLEVHRLLHGQVRRLLSLQDLVDVGGSPSKERREARPIGHEPPDFDKVP